MIGSDRWPIWLGYLNYSLPIHSESHKEPLTGDLLSQEIPPVSYFYSSWLTWCRLPAPASCHPCPVSSDEASNSMGIFDSQMNCLWVPFGSTTVPCLSGREVYIDIYRTVLCILTAIIFPHSYAIVYFVSWCFPVFIY